MDGTSGTAKVVEGLRPHPFAGGYRTTRGTTEDDFLVLTTSIQCTMLARVILMQMVQKRIIWKLSPPHLN